MNIHYHYEVVARLVGDCCTPASVHTKIIGGYYNPVMIDAPAAPASTPVRIASVYHAPLVSWVYPVVSPSYSPFLRALYQPVFTGRPYY